MKVILITGFSNWGKTSLIRDIFRRHNFSPDEAYPINGCDRRFVVLGRSNDDDNLDDYQANLSDSVKQARKKNVDVVAAFCPTRAGRPGQIAAGNNDSITILRGLIAQKIEVHVILIVHKWDLHAELRPKVIRQYYQGIANVHCHDVISQIRTDKAADVINLICSI